SPSTWPEPCACRGAAGRRPAPGAPTGVPRRAGGTPAPPWRRPTRASRRARRSVREARATPSSARRARRGRAARRAGGGRGRRARWTVSHLGSGSRRGRRCGSSSYRRRQGPGVHPLIGQGGRPRPDRFGAHVSEACAGGTVRRSLVAVAAAIGILVAGTGLAPAEVAQAADDTPVWWRNAAERTLLSPGNAAEPGWEGDRWVGYCAPEEYPEGCAEEGVHRAVWQFEGFDILRELEPEDITSATFILNGETGRLDDVGCTANSLEFYDAPLITPETGWSSTEAWTADKRVGQWSGYWSACEKTPRWTGYFSVDVTQLAVEAARDDRTSLAVGVRAADETCMTCGWNLLRQHAILRINFNRAPLAPSELSIGFLNTKVDCVDEPVLRTTMPFIGAVIPEPDGAS